jgi:hypothetical protein
MQARQSQQAWIISQQVLSPLVQVMQTPSLVHSHLQMPQARFNVQQGTPFIVQQQLHMPPASILHKFCRVPQATSSSHLQWSFMPPWHFSTLRVQRGTTHQLAAGAAMGADWPPMLGLPIPGKPRLARSINMALDIHELLFWGPAAATGCTCKLQRPDRMSVKAYQAHTEGYCVPLVSPVSDAISASPTLPGLAAVKARPPS